MKYFSTKYCLIDGIKEISADEPNHDGLLRIGYIIHHLGKDCFSNMEDAKAEAEKRRQAAIRSVKKRLAKLESLQF
jgi:hypothetical protein